MKKLIIIIPLISTLTGCFNYRELNELAIVSGISITKEGDDIKVTTEVINAKKEQDASKGNEPGFIIYSAKAKSVQEAIRKTIKESPQKMYGAHIEILVIDEKLAKENLMEILDFFARDPEIRSEFKVLIGKSNNILEITTPLENISSKNILDSLQNNNRYLGYANVVTYHELLSNTLNPNIELALPVLTIKGNQKEGEEKENIEKTKNEATSVIEGMAIFKNNKLKGYLTENEELAYNIINNGAKNFFIRTSKQKNQYIVHEIIRFKSSVEFNKEKKQIEITIKGKSAIADVNEKINLENLTQVKQLQKDLNEELSKQITSSINNIRKKYNSDIFGFADIIYKSDPKYFQQIKKDWYNGTFQNMKIKVISKIEGKEKGNLNRGVYS